MNTPTLYPCDVCDEDTDADTMSEDPEIQGIVCPDCRGDLKNAVSAMKDQGIRGLCSGPFCGTSNG